MARQVRSSALEKRTNRLQLAVRKKSYTARIGSGIRLAYRRNLSGGSWSVLKSNGTGGAWLQRFAAADDHEDANGSTVLTYWQACEYARRIARGDDLCAALDTARKDPGRALTVEEAVDAYQIDLTDRDADPANATRLRKHLADATEFRQKPVALLTADDVSKFRKGLLDKGQTRSNINRYMKALCACLTRAAGKDKRITNREAWRIEAFNDTSNPRNNVLSPEHVRAVVKASYQIGHRFGVFMETLAITGARASQVRRLVVGNLKVDHADGPFLMMPTSKKGKAKKRISHKPVPITASLATRLQAEAADRDNIAPLLRNDDDKPVTRAWTDRFAEVKAAAKLPKNATAYALRHTNITRQLLKGVPTRLVAAHHDTSEAMINHTYSENIQHHGADLVRATLLDLDPPTTPRPRAVKRPKTPNVVPISVAA